MTQRKAMWAGQFYPADANELRAMIRSFDKPRAAKVKARGAMVPHAGYVYSGPVAGAVYSEIEIPGKVIVLSTKHRMPGKDLALWESGTWATPLGEVEVDAELSRRLMKYCPGVEFDTTPHINEHSAEVQVPFLQYYNPSVKIAVMSVHSGNLKDLRAIGKGVAKAVQAEKKEVLIVASSDMSHYVSREIAEQKDGIALEAILAMDEEKLFHAIYRSDISMCGYAPTAVMIAACRELGATQARLVQYSTSGDVTGDHQAVVGYAGVIVA